MSAILNILTENATTLKQRRELHSLTENEKAAVGTTMVTNLYKSAIEKAHVDFDDIPESKGDITKYVGYKNLNGTINLLKSLSESQRVKINELDTVILALDNVTMYREQFTKGFQLHKEFVILQYNTLVMAIVEATSILVSTYVDFIKKVDQNEFVIVRDPRRQGIAVIQNLDTFNRSVKSGEFQKLLHAVINNRDNFTGVETAAIGTLVLAGAMTIVPLIRELIFGFYYSRMRIADHLEQQALFLEINRQSVEASSRPARERNEIVKKQARKIESMRALSEKIKVDRTISETKARKDLNAENRSWTIDSVRTQSASTDDNGFQLL